MLEVQSTNKGLLIPRVALTSTQDVTTITTPATSLLVYNTATTTGINSVQPGFYYWNGASWLGLAFDYTLKQNLITNNKMISNDGGINGLSFGDNGIFLSKGVFGAGADLTESGSGSKLIWYPKKAAFRAGVVDPQIPHSFDNGNIGVGSLGVGFSVIARGDYSTAIGYIANAFFAGSFALGTYVISNAPGAFTIGDGTSGSQGLFTNNDVPNQMMMRFNGGYKLYSDYGYIGMQLAPNSNAWSQISDKRKKEKFVPINGEDFLSKIDRFKMVSWNYKGQDSKTFRHYGPMAQDFYAAFGKDKYGTIGNDTLINQADFLGINFIAIQALEKRTNELKKQYSKVALLQKENASLKQTVAKLQSDFDRQERSIVQRIKELESVVLKQTSNPSTATTSK
ncbi:MAG: hypothetical protein NVSMB67_19610 [Flavisolibacter sp.]